MTGSSGDGFPGLGDLLADAAQARRARSARYWQEMTWSRRWPVGPADRGRVNTCPFGTSWPGWLPLESDMRWNIRYRLHRRVIEIRDA